MFNNARYATRGVVAVIPPYIQLMLWHMTETLEIEQDYLQVFKLSEEFVDGVKKQKIVHSQEVPPYSCEVTFDSEETVNAKVFIIDDKTHSTMLLAEEY